MNLDRIIKNLLEMKDTSHAIKSYIYDSPSENTKVNRLFSVRSYLKKIGREDLLDRFPIDKELLESFRENRQKYLDNKLNNKVNIYFTLEEYQSINNKIRDCYSNAYSLILAGINSGRRMVELSEGLFIKKSGNLIELVNPAKKRGKAKPIIFPLLFCSCDTFLQDIENFRKSNISSSYIREKTAVMFKAVDRDFSFHTLRALYGYYSYEKYCKDPSYDRLVWLSDVLGHDKSNYTSSLHYNKYFTDNKTKERLVHKVKIYQIENIKKSEARQYSKVESLTKKIDCKEIRELKRQHEINSNARNNRKSQYILLCEALQKESEELDNETLILRQKGMIRALRELYKKEYGKDIDGKTLKNFYNDFWSYSKT